MNKADVDKFPRGTSLYIVAHGLWRRSRGLKPSITKMGSSIRTHSHRMLDPIETFESALHDITQGAGGKFLEAHISDMVAAANLLGTDVKCDWGTGIITVKPGDSPETILATFQEQSEALRQAFWTSEEGIRFAREVEEGMW